jgi:hypothetical protein
MAPVTRSLSERIAPMMLVVGLVLISAPMRAQSIITSGSYLTTGGATIDMVGNAPIAPIVGIPSSAGAAVDDLSALHVDPWGRFLFTVNAPQPGTFSCATPLVIPGEPAGSTNVSICGTYFTQNSFVNMFAATAYGYGQGTDINAIAGTYTSMVTGAGGAGAVLLGKATAPLSVAHGAEIEADCFSDSCNTAAVFALVGGDDASTQPNGAFFQARSHFIGNSANYGIEWQVVSNATFPHVPPIRPNGSIMAVTLEAGAPPMQVANGIDLRQTQVTGLAYASPSFSVDGGGTTRINSASPVFSGNEGLSVYGRQFSSANNSAAPAVLIGNQTTGYVRNVEFYAWTGSSWADVGSIDNNGSTTMYNTVSDYRLKQDVRPLTGALARMERLRPVRFAFKSDPGNRVDGFLAHEAAVVVPEAVVGGKDGPEMQKMDAAKLVPLLTAAIKELEERVRVLEARLAQ